MRLNKRGHIEKLFNLIQLEPRLFDEPLTIQNKKLACQIKVNKPFLQVQVVNAVANKLVLLKQMSQVESEHAFEIRVQLEAFELFILHFLPRQTMGHFRLQPLDWIAHYEYDFCTRIVIVYSLRHFGASEIGFEIFKKIFFMFFKCLKRSPKITRGLFYCQIVLLAAAGAIDFDYRHLLQVPTFAFHVIDILVKIVYLVRIAAVQF